jgi:hypothetical protein
LRLFLLWQNVVYAQQWRLEGAPALFIRARFKSFCLMRLRRVYFNRNNGRERCLATLAINAYIAMRRSAYFSAHVTFQLGSSPLGNEKVNFNYL